MFFILSPDMFHGRAEYNFYTIIEDASGIVAKTQVKTSGVVIGKVKSVRLEGNQSRIDFSVQADTKIPQGSEIMIREKGLLGDVFLEVVRADDKGEYLQSGDFIPPAKEQVSLSKLITVANSIGKDIKKITSSFAEVVGGEQGHKNISSIVTDVRDVASSLKSILSENRDDFKKIMTNLNRTSNTIDNIVSGKKHDISEIIANIKTLTGSLRDVLNPDNRVKFDRIIASLDSTTADVKSIAEKINKGEGTIGRLVNDDKMINDVEGAVKDLRSVIAPVKKMQVAVDFHAEYKGNSRTQGFLRVILQPRPDKFYLIGITDLVESEKETFIEQLPANPGETAPNATSSNRVHRTSVERTNLAFDLQFGQRWSFAQIRFGLFQSTGGLAGDFFLLNDHLRFTVEAFDVRKTSKRNLARLKTYASILFFNHLYAMVGADELTRRDPFTGIKEKPLYFFGGGFYFTDDDLKALFGLASSRI
jgi:phospholipid/cholesterol/gamma-HCH transport system substrate-binding protein